MAKCVFAGTFDPFTVGHLDTVSQCLRLFDETVVAIATNPAKHTLFTAQERLEMISEVFAGEPRVRALIWEGTAADLLAAEQTPFYVRGIRSALDFCHEEEDLRATQDFAPQIMALFLPTAREYAHVSSTLVRNCIAFGKDYRAYVPEAVYTYLHKRG